jgi:6-phosphogluconolactonase
MGEDFLKIIRCDSLPQCYTAIGGFLQEFIQAAIDRQGYCTLALSGGKTPAALFQVLSRPPFLTTICWQKVYFFFGDERFVPPSHQDSNFGMAQKNLLAHLPITEAQVFRMPVEIRPYVAAASHYQRIMAEAFSTLKARPCGQYPAFDLVLLGMGDDGHTASLFPGHPALGETGWVAEVEAEGAKPPVPRLTLTLPVLNNADTVLFLISGVEKIKLADSFLSGPPQPRYPASLVRPRKRLLWYLAD